LETYCSEDYKLQIEIREWRWIGYTLWKGNESIEKGIEVEYAGDQKESKTE
jgi:hypothetical protein